jgi:hypothetical protein
MKTFYERNDYVLDNPDVNVCFEDVLFYSEEEFISWVRKVKDAILYSWDTFGCPLKSGLSEAEIIEQFSQLIDVVDMHQTKEEARKISKKGVNRSFETIDLSDETGTTLVFQNIQRDGTAVDQFFPTMMKTRINYSIKNNGYSVYDLFSDETKFSKLVTISRKCIRRDSFYYFSRTVNKNSNQEIFKCDTALQFIELWNDKNNSLKEKMGLWIDGKKKPKSDKSTGYSQVELKNQLFFTKDELLQSIIDGKISSKQVNTLKQPLSDEYLYYIRIFEYGKKVFPHAFRAYRIGDIQIAVNFPPMTAKFLIEKYTRHIENQDEIIYYDPSSGWGGRILGAMSYYHKRPDGSYVKLHYVGNDPNPDNYIPELNKTRYECVAEFFNEKVKSNRINVVFGNEPINTYEIFREGSEYIHKNPDFQKYKGKLDLVFTSPPYFAKEAYSDDEKQSYKAHSTYEAWRDNFLYPTLKTAVEYLKEDRYLLWNIADVQFDGRWLPLLTDSINILRSFGMEISVNKMALMNMPGQNRIGEDGKPTSGSFARIINSKGQEEWIKTEPVIVAYKPKRKDGC